MKKQRSYNLGLNFVNGSVPSYLCNFVKRLSDVHGRSTRYRSNLDIPKCKTSSAQRSFRYRAIELWNSIPNDVRESSTLNSFKQ